MRIKREEVVGNLSSMRCRKSVMVEEGPVCKDSVGGRPSPEKLVMRMFKVPGAILSNARGYLWLFVEEEVGCLSLVLTGGSEAGSWLEMVAISLHYPKSSRWHVISTRWESNNEDYRAGSTCTKMASGFKARAYQG